MSRLIDADQFEVLSWDATGDTSYDQGFGDGATFVAEKIDAAPTIDAIPVEWLKGLVLSEGDDVDKVEFAWIMRKWQKEQEAR